MISKTCTHEGCKTIPNYNHENETKTLYCSVHTVHKEDGMVNVISKTCTHEGCKTLPIYNYDNETKSIYCSVHKKDGMVNHECD